MANIAIDTNSATRNFLMRMGNAWFDKGEIRQALDVYLKFLDEYPGTEESITAQYVLLNIAQRYEHEGLFRLSLDVLERLEQTQVILHKLFFINFSVSFNQGLKRQES